jgi:hypothetical protein
MNISTAEKQDKDIFKAIFRDHWDEFTSVYPAYKEKQ